MRRDFLPFGLKQGLTTFPLFRNTSGAPVSLAISRMRGAARLTALSAAARWGFSFPAMGVHQLLPAFIKPGAESEFTYE